MALGAFSAPDEQKPPALRGVGYRTLVTMRVAIVRGVERIERLLERGDRTPERARGWPCTIGDLELLAILRVGADSFDGLGDRQGHLNRILDREDGLIFERFRAPIPEQRRPARR